jgi:hypothetical protein
MTVVLGDPRNRATPTQRWDGLTASGQFMFSAGSIVLPEDAPELFNISIPFTVSGMLTGSANGMPVVQTLPFSFLGRRSGSFSRCPELAAGEHSRRSPLNIARASREISRLFPNPCRWSSSDPDWRACSGGEGGPWLRSICGSAQVPGWAGDAVPFVLLSANRGQDGIQTTRLGNPEGHGAPQCASTHARYALD